MNSPTLPDGFRAASGNGRPVGPLDQLETETGRQGDKRSQGQLSLVFTGAGVDQGFVQDDLEHLARRAVGVVRVLPCLDQPLGDPKAASDPGAAPAGRLLYYRRPALPQHLGLVDVRPERSRVSRVLDDHGRILAAGLELAAGCVGTDEAGRLGFIIRELCGLEARGVKLAPVDLTDGEVVLRARPDKKPLSS